MALVSVRSRLNQIASSLSAEDGETEAEDQVPTGIGRVKDKLGRWLDRLHTVPFVGRSLSFVDKKERLRKRRRGLQVG